MDSKLAAVFVYVSVVHFSITAGGQGAEDTSASANDTKIRPYDKFRAIEMIRAQVLKKTTFHTVCRSKVIPTGNDIIISDMTLESRYGGENTNFEFVKMKDDHTLGLDSEVMEATNVKTINECVARCCSNTDCKAYVYEDQEKKCKLAKTCKPSLVPADRSQVFTMSYWY